MKFHQTRVNVSNESLRCNTGRLSTIGAIITHSHSIKPMPRPTWEPQPRHLDAEIEESTLDGALMHRTLKVLTNILVDSRLLENNYAMK